MYIIDIEGYGLKVLGELSFKAVPLYQATKFPTKEAAQEFANEVELWTVYKYSIRGGQ